MCGTHFRRRREASPHTLNCMAYARRWSIFFKPVLLFYFSQAANVVLGGSSALVGGASNEASTTTPLANNGRARFVYFHLFFFLGNSTVSIEIQTWTRVHAGQTIKKGPCIYHSHVDGRQRGEDGKAGRPRHAIYNLKAEKKKDETGTQD